MTAPEKVRQRAEPNTACGTYGGYQRHLRRGQDACEACKEACSEYARNRRAANPEGYADERARSAARTRATWRLVAENRERFRELFIEEVTRGS